jgi:hypothetical protein
MAKRQRRDVPAATSASRSTTACAGRSAWSAIRRGCRAPLLNRIDIHLEVPADHMTALRFAPGSRTTRRTS